MGSIVPPEFTPERLARYRRDPIAFLEEQYVCRNAHTGRNELVRLEPWQRKLLGDILATRRPDGRRRYNMALIGLAKKNGKSEMGAMVATWFAFCDEPEGEIVIAANDMEQASTITFKRVARAIRNNPVLARECKIGRYEIRVLATGTVIRAIAHDTPGAAGNMANCTIFDELWGLRDREFYHQLTQNPVRKQPLTLITTYAGYDRNSLLYELYERGRRGDDPAFYFFWPEGEDAANPASWVTREYLEQQRRRLPAQVFRRLHCNQWSTPDEPSPERVVVERRERQLHTAVRYGVSQALLRAVALTRGVTMAEVVAEEWGLPAPGEPVPIHAQSGGERYHNADKMIARRVASLPHALVDDVAEQLGQDGSRLVRYVRWLVGRIRTLGGPDYNPTIHLDVHGALGQICEGNLGRVLGQLHALELASRPYALRIESPVILESRAAQIEALRTLREYVRFRKMNVQLVADEWANTLEDVRAFVDAQAADVIQIKMPDLGGVHNAVEAVLACRAGGVGAFLGGSCCETDLSARASVHVALATRPDFLWPSRAWAWTRASCWCRTRWPARWPGFSRVKCEVEVGTMDTNYLDNGTFA